MPHTRIFLILPCLFALFGTGCAVTSAQPDRSLPVPSALTGWWEPLGKAVASSNLHLSETGIVQIAFPKNLSKPFDPHNNAQYDETYPLNVFHIDNGTIYAISKQARLKPAGEFYYQYVKLHARPSEGGRTVLWHESKNCSLDNQSWTQSHAYHWQRFNSNYCSDLDLSTYIR